MPPSTEHALGQSPTSTSRPAAATSSTPSAEVARQLGTDVVTGLDAVGVARQLAEFGPNESREAAPSRLRAFAKRFVGLTAWMLEGTVAVAIALHRYVDATVVLALLVTNGVLGYFQEQRAADAVSTLKKRLQTNARVLRSRAWSVIPGRELVPGDVLRVRAGDLVPADVQIVEGSVDVDQSALTGESALSSKHIDDRVNGGSIVRRGEGTAIVVATGSRTFSGRTAQLVQIARPVLHVEHVIAQVVRTLLVIVGGSLIVAVTVSVVRGESLWNLLPLLLLLLVSAIPVALPAMFTLTMALGAVDLARHGVLVTRLSASEDAARMDILCADKTGTITRNTLTVVEIVPAAGFTRADVLRSAALASEDANQDPIDVAILAAARAEGCALDEGARTAFVPFSADTRRTEATYEGPGGTLRLTKGAIATVLALSASTPEPSSLVASARGFEARGFRALAVATAHGGAMFSPVGVIALQDEARSDAGAWIAELRDLGVAVKMLTGDAMNVARDVARAVKLGDRIASALELRQLGAKNDRAAADLAERSDGFAEVFPEDKFLVVRALQRAGHVVGMTGDGVNDAPALRQAEVGVAVMGATDVAKAAAGAVLTTDELGAVPRLIRIGRVLHGRIETWIVNKIAKTTTTVGVVVLAYLVSGQFVVSAFGMVLLLFLVDFVTLSLATDTASGTKVPARWEILRLSLKGASIGVACVAEITAVLLTLQRIFGLSGVTLQTLGFEMLLFFGMATVFVVRERGWFFRSRPSLALAGSMAAATLVSVIAASVGLPGLAPIGWGVTGCAVGATLALGLFANDALKMAITYTFRARSA